ncbi:MAG: hypothetical protein U1F10_00085 [Burkholderiales bacterium]
MLTFSLRPVTAALVAIALATACVGAARAAAPAEAGIAPADVKALVAQAKELAGRQQDIAIDGERLRVALDEELLGLPPSMAFAGSELGQPREIVKNAPYTADAVTETVQLLQDGNRIVRKSTSFLARDTQGRTRQERKGDGRGGVFIYDPMDGRTIVLNESSRTVMRLPRLPEPPDPPVVGPHPPAPPAPPAPAAGVRDGDAQPGRVVVKRTRGPEGGEDVRVEVVRVARGDGNEALPPPPPLPPLALPTLPRGKGESKSLGTREFDGLKAEGTLTTHTIPAGQIGNEKPIVVTSERWFSPDLFVVVYAKTTDPRVGETIYRLTNVKRGEPSPDLFKVPADYRNRGEPRKGQG